MRYFKIQLIILAFVFMFTGCAKKNQIAITPPSLSEPPAISETKEEKVAKNAISALGVQYKRGGNNKSGFDCSGLVRYVYNELGINLPRRAAEQARVGRDIKNVDELQPGDIMVFRYPDGYHTGVYLKDGDFVHSSVKYHSVVIASIKNPYHRKNFQKGKRIL